MSTTPRQMPDSDDAKSITPLPPSARIAVIEGRLAQLGAHQQSVSTWLSAREALVLEHQRARLLAEVDWHRHLLSTLGSPEAAALGSAADRGPQR